MFFLIVWSHGFTCIHPCVCVCLYVIHKYFHFPKVLWYHTDKGDGRLKRLNILCNRSKTTVDAKCFEILSDVIILVPSLLDSLTKMDEVIDWTLQRLTKVWYENTQVSTITTLKPAKGYKRIHQLPFNVFIASWNLRVFNSNKFPDWDHRIHIETCNTCVYMLNLRIRRLDYRMQGRRRYTVINPPYLLLTVTILYIAQIYRG